MTEVEFVAPIDSLSIFWSTVGGVVSFEKEREREGDKTRRCNSPGN